MSLQKSPELLRRQATLLCNISHRLGVDWICARDLDGPHAITHGNVFALANYNDFSNARTAAR